VRSDLAWIAPYIPPIDPSNASDTQNFDDTFLDMEPVLDDVNENEQTDTDQEREQQTDTDRTDGEESNTTPSQSRSSSMQPRQPQHLENSVDVFDGYSFKGRHSLLVDEEEEDEDEDEEEDVTDSRDILADLVETPDVDRVQNEDVTGPKTPEARSPALPETVEEEVEVSPEPPVVEEEPVPQEAEPFDVSRKSADLSRQETTTPVPELPPSSRLEKETKPKPTTAPSKVDSSTRLGVNHKTRARREKSGVPALDRYLSDAIDGDATEREDEDDDWDIVEAADGEDRNGYKGTSYFARGVVDRYRLAVFRKASTPSRRPNPRSFSGMSKESDGSTTVVDSTESPSPPDKLRRGRNPGLNFRKNPRQFLRAKSPAPAPSTSKSNATGKIQSPSSNPQSNPGNLSAASTMSSAGLLVPSTTSSMPLSPSLKSKESAVSVGAQSLSSDHSGNGDAGGGQPQQQLGLADNVRASPPEETEKPKNKKLKKYKENAEKVFSLFAGSPRQPS
jgi:serum/glucocorticoid-regulated kinase 2